jgi:hypothetical protein
LKAVCNSGNKTAMFLIEYQLNTLKVRLELISAEPRNENAMNSPIRIKNENQHRQSPGNQSM